MSGRILSEDMWKYVKFNVVCMTSSTLLHSHTLQVTPVLCQQAKQCAMQYVAACFWE